jgi:hypothetical protein
MVTEGAASVEARGLAAAGVTVPLLARLDAVAAAGAPEGLAAE